MLTWEASHVVVNLAPDRVLANLGHTFPYLEELPVQSIGGTRNFVMRSFEGLRVRE